MNSPFKLNELQISRNKQASAYSESTTSCPFHSLWKELYLIGFTYHVYTVHSSHYTEIFMNCLQRLRCKCNFHALKFAPEIERVGALLIKRIRKFDAARNNLDKQLLGNFMSNAPLKGKNAAVKDQSKYLALHLRFEVDMVAYSQCEFGGGEDEREELRAYRESHFPLLAERLEKSKYTLLLYFEFFVVFLCNENKVDRKSWLRQKISSIFWRWKTFSCST